MYYKWIGGVLILLASGGFGIVAAYSHRREETMVNQLLFILQFMESELNYHLTPLPELCRISAGQASGTIRSVLLSLAEQLETRQTADVSSCVRQVLTNHPALSRQIYHLLSRFGDTLGRFDLSGQIQALNALETECSCILQDLRKNRETRMRSCRTLGFCAGAALVILFM